MVKGIEKVAMLITRYRALELLYLEPAGFIDEIGFEEALIGLYIAVLKFEYSAIRFYGTNMANKYNLAIILIFHSLERWSCQGLSVSQTCQRFY